MKSKINLIVLYSIHHRQNPSKSTLFFVIYYYYYWLMHYATSWKVTDSIPDHVIGFFNELNPSRGTMALRSTEPLTEMSTRNFSGGKGRLARETVSRCLENVGASTYYKPYGPSRPVTGTALPFFLFVNTVNSR
jgi:hypothetical protein